MQRLPLSRRGRELAGYVLLAATPVVWVIGFEIAFTLSYLAGGPGVNTDPPSSSLVLSSTMYALSGLVGLGRGFVGLWQAVNLSAALISLILFSLTITFIVQIVTAKAHERSVASGITALGDTPYEIAGLALEEKELGTLPLQMVTLGSGLSRVGQDHLAFPILQYMDSGKKETSMVLAAVVFDELVTLLEYGARGNRRLLTRNGRSSVTDYIQTLNLRPVEDDPPELDLCKLDADAHRVTNQKELSEGLATQQRRRKLLSDLLQKNALGWEDVYPGLG